MALIIKGDMPSICKKCKSQGGLTDGSFNYICCDDNYLDFYCDGSKPNECQILCEIPDKHGRLIDADAMLDKLEKIVTPDDLAHTIAHGILEQIVEDANTIVEATE